MAETKRFYDGFTKYLIVEMRINYLVSMVNGVSSEISYSKDENLHTLETFNQLWLQNILE